MEPAFEYSLPAIRGIQAKREYYVSMFPLRLIPKIFLFNEEELRPELRAQRVLNKARLPEMAHYLLDNKGDYVFSALTASVDGEIRFEPIGKADQKQKMGVLHISMDSRFIINDGQHRRAAIEMALREKPELADETIAVVLFLDIGLERCQQMFADLNRYAIRPSTSLGILYDYRDDRAKLTRLVVARSPVFRDVVEKEKSSLAPRSRKLFTLSAIHTATIALVAGMGDKDIEDLSKLAVSYWDEVAKHMHEWNLVREGKMTAGEVRSDFIHSHGIALQALGRVGNTLLANRGSAWKKKLKDLSRIDWRRANAKLWEGRALSAGAVSKAGRHVCLTTNAIKKRLKIPLSAEEKRVETAFKRGDYE